MTCPRCHGVMMAVKMVELATSEAVPGWRCLLCGEVTDSVIEANRKGHSEPVRNRARLPLAS
jgi:hypothetical protein